jgi:hypothetical protein
MKKKLTLVAGIVMLALALMLGLFVFSPGLGKSYEYDLGVLRHMTSEDVAQADSHCGEICD